MAVTVWDVIHDDVFQQCDPYIAGGETGIDNVVRWAYTHERYDVTQFLIGGEFLIIEGSSLAEHSDDEGLRAYIDSLEEAHISGLAIELVDFFTEIPEAMSQRGNEIGLPIIGLRKRQPFVMLCQEINTRITREQLLSHMAIDNLSSALNARLSESRSVQDIATALADTTGERVLIITPDGEVCAQAGMEISPLSHHDSQNTESLLHGDIVLRIARDGFTVANVVISQRMTVMNDDAKRHIISSLSQSLPPFMSLSIRSKLMMRLLAGCRDGIVASHEEEMDAQAMLRALDYLPQVHCCSFMIGIRQWNGRAHVMETVLTRLHEKTDNAVTLLAEIEGSSIVGAFMCDDAARYDALSDYGERYLSELLPNDDICILTGGLAIGAKSMLDTIAGLRFAFRSAYPHWGLKISANQFAYARMLSIGETRLAIDAFVAQVAGSLMDVDDVMIDTLCALSDDMGSKTEACMRLGIKRQTLYNRLERVEQITGISQHDSMTWSLMLVAAKMVQQLRIL